MGTINKLLNNNIPTRKIKMGKYFLKLVNILHLLFYLFLGFYKL